MHNPALQAMGAWRLTRGLPHRCRPGIGRPAGVLYGRISGARPRQTALLHWAIALTCFAAPCTSAHTSLERYVRESIFISVSAENVDIRVRFSFPAALSLTERQSMDRDGDGAISKKEQETYLKAVQTRARDQLRLSLNGKTATLIALEDPLLDLQDAPGVEAHPHELCLAYFARIPKDFGIDGAISLDSGGWAGMPLMLSVFTETADGIRIRSTVSQGLMQPTEDGAMVRITEAHCTQWEPAGKRNGGK